MGITKYRIAKNLESTEESICELYDLIYTSTFKFINKELMAFS